MNQPFTTRTFYNKPLDECRNHPGVAGSKACTACDQFLCEACSTKFFITACPECLLSLSGAIKFGIKRKMAISLIPWILWILLVIILVAVDSVPNSEMDRAEIGRYLIICSFGIFGTFTYWGWQTITRAWPRPDLLRHYLFYYIIKTFIAYIIGFVVGPYQIIKNTIFLFTIKRQVNLAYHEVNSATSTF